MNLSTAPLAHDINNNAFQNNLMKQNIANNPSPNNLPEQVRFSNRSVSTTPPKKSIWSSIKSVPRKISIFFRAVAKVVVLGYYFVKHVVIKKPVDTPQKLNSILNNLGPAFAKIMQPMIGNIGESSSLVSQGLLRFPDDKKDFTPDETRKIKEMTTAVKGILDNIKTTDMTCEQAQTILNKRFKGKYTVGDCLGAGTIASCYEITSNTDGTKYVAKVMSPKTEDQLAVGIRSLELFSWLIPKSFKSIVQSTLSAFRDECNLSSEHRKLCGFRTAIMAADKLGRFSHKLEKTKYTTLNGHQIPEPDITTIEADLSFSVPEAVEPLDPNNDNLLIMQKADGHTLATLMTNRALFSQEFKKCFARDPETVDQQREDDHDELQSLESAILERVSAKWNQVLATQGWVHGDLHPGNIMISFKPDNKIVVSLIDLGNSLKLEDSELQFVKDLFNSVKSFAATTKTPGDMINPEYPNFRRPIYHVTGNNKEKILDNLYSNDAEQIKSLFDLVMRQASNKKLSDKMKENIYR
nr:phosphotransferase [Endozoicomonas sp.]